MFKAGEPDVGDDGAAEEVDEQALDPLHLEVLLEDGSGEEEAGLRAGGDLVVGELLETFELDDPELNHVMDVLIESAQGLQAIEIKSGSTFASDWTDGLKKWQKFAGEESFQPSLVYGGTDSHEREGVQVWGWSALSKLSPLR